MTQPPSLTDQTAPVRDGEGLDHETLRAWMRDALPDLQGDLSIEQFPGGHSNLTYLLRVGSRELVLRRPPFGAKIKSAHDMAREYRILSSLHQAFSLVPQPLALCTDEAVLGADFYVMERVQGLILRQRIPKGLDLSETRMRRLSESLIDALVNIHAVDLSTVGLDSFGKPEGYVQRQVDGWTRRYMRAKTDEIASIEHVAAWLADNQPPETGATLIHNDYKYDNVVYDPSPEGLDAGRILAVLDWEMATVGDPLMDLGTSLGYWVDPDDNPTLHMLPFGPTARPGNLSRLDVVERYAAQSGRDVSNIVFYYVYALFKIAGILQQIYARYKSGHSSDPRFAIMIEGVKLLGAQAQRAVELNRIDRLG